MSVSISAGTGPKQSVFLLLHQPDAPTEIIAFEANQVEPGAEMTEIKRQLKTLRRFDLLGPVEFLSDQIVYDDLQRPLIRMLQVELVLPCTRTVSYTHLTLPTTPYV